MIEEHRKKASLRREVLEQAALLDENYKKEADMDICRRVVEAEEFQRANTVFCYVGCGNEIDTSYILECALEEGKKLCVPLCEKRGIMTARQIFSLGELLPGLHDIPEPSQDAPTVAPEEIDLAVVPCVTCNESGERLGYGGGYYDRYLRLTPCEKIMICRKKLMREEIPTEKHDLQIGKVIWERENSN